MMLITVITISEIVKCPVVPESVPVISDLSSYCPHGTTLKGGVRYHFILHIKRETKKYISAKFHERGIVFIRYLPEFCI